MTACFACGRALTKDERGLNRKLFDLPAAGGNFRCLTCLADYLDCTEEDLRDKIEQFKEEGCKLFG